ncbi:tetratricopeptide repeat protein [Solitalea longa]|uniref:tetratricopeptide repeat protein n=1 Tax=Solitalea longa TaxID=2079460 RepID=UPI0013FE16DC|nr:tetratricopeptide repeat protein [Solitalea longa]
MFQQTVKAQSNSTVDSLTKQLNKSTSVEEKLRLQLLLCEQLYKTNSTLALKYAYESEQLATEINSDSLLNQAYLQQATAHLYLGNHPTALNLFLKSITGARKMDDSKALFSAYENLAILYYYQKDHNNALKYLFEALNQYNRTKPASSYQNERRVYVLNNIGMVYNETGRFNESAKYFNEALTLARKLNNNELIANVLSNQGNLFNNQGMKDSALKQYTHALELRIKDQNKFGLSQSYLSLGQFYISTKNYKKAELNLKEAVALGKEVKYWQNVSIASSLLFHIYEQIGDYKNALATLELNKSTSDSLYNEQNTRKIAQLEMQHEFDHKHAEIMSKQRVKNLYYGLAGISLALSIIILALFYYLQRTKTQRLQFEKASLEHEKQKLESDIIYKDKELGNNILHLSNKNELIETISGKLIDIKQNIEETAKPAVQKILSELQSNLQPDLMQDFELRFKQVHVEFYSALNKRFPDLTPSEQRLCAFLKLNMTSKEISTITHQNVKSIETARTRLRKKLNLTDSDQSLTDFLSQIDTHSAESEMPNRK